MPARLAVLTLTVATTYVAGGLWLDRYVDAREQFLLGLLTAAVLGVLLYFHPAAVRLQTLAVVGIAGHRRLETTRRYSLPSARDRERAMEGLRVDY